MPQLQAAVFEGRHLPGLEALDQAAAGERTQDAGAHCSLHLGHGRIVNAPGRMKHNARWRCRVAGDVTPQRLEHPIDRTNMTTKLRRRPTTARRACYAEAKMHMGVQARPTTKLKCRLTCTQVMSQLDRWMKATAPICTDAVSSLAAPGQWRSRYCAMTLEKMRSRRCSAPPRRAA